MCCVCTVCVGEEGEGEESGSVTPVPATRAARRKTDLLPTLPSPRDLPPRSYSARTPGRAYSMSRLDVLAQPRKPRVTPPPQEPQTRDPSLSQSMSHLAARPLRRTDTSRSMHQLAFSAPVPPPRVTRAERLRRKAREAANAKAESVPTSPGTAYCPCLITHIPGKINKMKVVKLYILNNLV